VIHCHLLYRINHHTANLGSNIKSFFYIYLCILPGEERKMHRKMSMHQTQGSDTAKRSFYSIVTIQYVACVFLCTCRKRFSGCTTLTDALGFDWHYYKHIGQLLLHGLFLFSLTRRSLLETR